MQRSLSVLSVALLVGAVLVACSGAAPDVVASSDQGLSADKKHKDAGVDGASADTGAPAVEAGSGGSDGPPTRQPCTSNFGKGLSGSYGRLDGFLVSIVAPQSGGACNEDKSHVHLQIQMSGGIYDVAVNADGGFYLEKDLPLPGGAWSEGWHSADRLDYVNDLDVHAADFQTGSLQAVASWIESELAETNHISVFATAYNSSGIHDVHRESSNKDGAIILDPLSATPHVLLFHFSDQSF